MMPADPSGPVPSIPTLIITGPVGVGKTTVANALYDRLSKPGTRLALVDLDSLRLCYPAPPDDPFQLALGLRNLAALWANYRAMGATRLIVADVVETRASLHDYREAIPGAVLQVVRLQASLATLHGRLEQRETGASLRWHQQRAAELSALMDERHVEDMLVDTGGKPVSRIADEILSRAAWIDVDRDPSVGSDG